MPEKMVTMEIAIPAEERVVACVTINGLLPADSFVLEKWSWGLK
jgi:hypothetical protein